MGIRLSAATSGVLPRTSCRYCSSRKIRPKNAKNCTVIDKVAAVKARCRNSRGSISGFGRESSQRTNPARISSPCDADQGGRAAPAPGGGLDHRVDQRTQARDGECRPDEVELRCVGLRGLGDEARGADDRHGGQHDVQPEHRLP